MFTFEGPNKRSYELRTEDQSSLLKFSLTGGGNIPKELSGTFTSFKYANTVWAKYIAGYDDSQKDMRLKSNKKQKTTSTEE